jgi:hypothetical protein
MCAAPMEMITGLGHDPDRPKNIYLREDRILPTWPP